MGKMGGRFTCLKKGFRQRQSESFQREGKRKQGRKRKAESLWMRCSSVFGETPYHSCSRCCWAWRPHEAPTQAPKPPKDGSRIWCTECSEQEAHCNKSLTIDNSPVSKYMDYLLLPSHSPPVTASIGSLLPTHLLCVLLEAFKNLMCLSPWF